MKIRPIVSRTITSMLLGMATSHATIVSFADYPLGEAGSLGGSNKPQDISGQGRNFGDDINGGSAVVGSTSFHPDAIGSTAYIDTSNSGNEGWYSGGLFNSLPTNNFAFGVFARAASLSGTNGDVFTTGDSSGSFKVSLEGNGWAASCHNVDWIGNGGGTVGSFQPDTWVHLAVIRSAGVTTFYIDGVAQGSTYAGTPVHNSPHMSVQPGGGAYFDGQIDEARVVTFSAGESTANILTALQRGVIPTSFVNVGATATFRGASLSTDETSYFRLGGAVVDHAVLTTADGLSVTAGTAPKHLIRITQEGEIPIGTYPLIDYSGTIGGLGYAGLQLAPLPGRIAGHLVNNTETSTIDLEITGSQAGDITWKGSAGGIWNVEGNTNWVFSGGVTPTAFYAGDIVRLDDNASTGSITVAETVTPSSMIVENSTRDYTISGAGIGGSCSIEKYGTGTLTLTNPNSHSGGNYFDSGTVRIGDGGSSGALGTGPISNNTTLIINRTGTLEMPGDISGEGSLEKLGSGTLVLGGNSSFAGPVTLTAGIISSGNANSLGSSSTGTTVAAGATLDAFPRGFGEEPILLNGSGVGGLGAIVNNGGSQNQNGVKKVTLASDSSIGGVSRWDVRGDGSFVDGNFKLTKTGSNQISLVLAVISVKDIVVNGGLLSVEYGASVNNSNPGSITVSAGTLGFGSFGNPISCSKPIILNGGSIDTTSGGNDGSATVASAIGLTASTNTINVQSGATITATGVVSGSGSLQKTGSGSLFLTAAPTYTGDTTVSDGTLILAQGGLANSASVRLGPSSTLNLAFAGTDTVDRLFINGVQQPAGVYNSTNSSGRVTGSGTLTVSSSPAGYAAWEATNGLAGAGSTADSDDDGIPNGIEFVIGGDPSGPESDSTALLPTSAKNTTHLIFSYRLTDESIPDSPHVQYGSNLTGWTTARENIDGVTFETTNISSGINLVTVRIPLGLANGAKLFARLAVEIH